MGVKQISGAASSSALDPLLRGLEIRLLIGGLNDGDVIPQPAAAFPGWSRFQSQLAATSYGVLSPTAGGTTVQCRVLDGRRSAQWFGVAGQNSVWVLRPGGNAGSSWFLDFGSPVFQPLTVALQQLPTPQFGWATEVMAWCRKLNGGDSSSCRMGLGYANNTVVSPSAPITRCGLFGDGAGGYRYGSVNCPDGAIGGPNGDADVDANAVQPTDIQAPGVSWWHSRIKLVPATPLQGARWAAYHNGKRVGLFTSESNFPRGHQTTNDHYGRIEATIWNFSGDVAALHVPELCLWDVRFWLHDDYTV